MEISASLVKELRDRSGAGMMDCKKVLAEANGDIEAAIQLLKEKGLAKAAKKAGNIAAEGLVLINIDADNKNGLMLELNCETDFAAKSPDFKALSAIVVDYFVKNGKEVGTAVDMQEKFYDAAIEEITTTAIAKIGENIKPRRFVKYAVNANGYIHSYVHLGGKIGVMIEIEADKPEATANPELHEMADSLCMQIASMKPECVNPDEFPTSLIESERAAYRVQVLELGKPENMVDKIVDGKIKKYISDNTLLEQVFVMNNDLVIKDYIKGIGNKIGAAIKVKRFSRFEMGEGIAKKQDNFAEEVAAQVKNS